jgi:hypothetical protein
VECAALALIFRRTGALFVVTSEPDIIDVLKQYDCPHTAAVVRMRFWGAINSPAERISPIEEFDALWHGKRRRFENEDEAQAFYDVMIRFWNDLAENRASGRPITFAMRSGLNTIGGLKSTMAARHAELRGGSVCLNRFRVFLKWIPALVMPPPVLAAVR